MTIRRLILVRHGETEGESRIRYYGSTDVELSAEGLAQMRQVARELRNQPTDLVLASTLRRSWGGARVVGGGASVRLLAGLREIDFGRWEGLTKPEIQAQDPVLYEDWQRGADGFEYPGGELRADFQSRVSADLEMALAAPGNTAVGVLHKGVIREIVRHLTGAALEADQPALGERLVLIRLAAGWRLGQRSSDPAGVNEAA